MWFCTWYCYCEYYIFILYFIKFNFLIMKHGREWCDHSTKIWEYCCKEFPNSIAKYLLLNAIFFNQFHYMPIAWITLYYLWFNNNLCLKNFKGISFSTLNDLMAVWCLHHLSLNWAGENGIALPHVNNKAPDSDFRTIKKKLQQCWRLINVS